MQVNTQYIKMGRDNNKTGHGGQSQAGRGCGRPRNDYKESRNKRDPEIKFNPCGAWSGRRTATLETVKQHIIKYIQKNYDYGLTDIRFKIFDIQINGEYCNVDDSYNIVRNLMILQYVDILYKGAWSKSIQDSFVFNNFIEGTKIPHEGVVVKCTTGSRDKISKVINPDYLIWSEKHDVGDSH